MGYEREETEQHVLEGLVIQERVLCGQSEPVLLEVGHIQWRIGKYRFIGVGVVLS